MNNGDGSYTLRELPEEAQFSPVFAVAADNFTQDEADTTEFVLAGNFSGVKPEEGRYDANHGLVMEVEDGELVMESNQITGLNIRGEVRQLATARSVGGKKLLIVAKNNDALEFYEYE